MWSFFSNSVKRPRFRNIFFSKVHPQLKPIRNPISSFFLTHQNLPLNQHLRLLRDDMGVNGQSDIESNVINRVFVLRQRTKGEFGLAMYKNDMGPHVGSQGTCTWSHDLLHISCCIFYPTAPLRWLLSLQYLQQSNVRRKGKKITSY